MVGEKTCLRDEAMLNSEETKPIALAVIELCSQSDSQSVGWSVSQSIEKSVK